MTTDEKRKLGAGLCHLSPDDLNKALEIVAQDNPSFQTKAEEVDLDMDAQVMVYVFPCAHPFFFVSTIDITGYTTSWLRIKERIPPCAFNLRVSSYHFSYFFPVCFNYAP